MKKEKIVRINQLAKLSKERLLTPEELVERDELRKEYVASVRQSLTSQLDVTYFVETDGTQQKLEKKKSPMEQGEKP